MLRGTQSRGVLAGMLLALFACLIAGLGWLVPQATAAQTDLYCNQLSRVLPIDGRKTIAVAAHWQAQDCDEPARADLRLIRFDPSGEVDLTFGEGGMVETGLTSDDGVAALLQGPSGTTILVGPDRVTRYKYDGSRDYAFQQFRLSSDAAIRGATLLPDGRIALLQQVGGLPAVTMLNGSGTRDATFGDSGVKLIAGAPWSAGTASFFAIGADPTGRVVIGGLEADPAGGGSRRVTAVRLRGDGGLDAGFGPGSDGFARSPAFSCFSGGYVECDPADYGRLEIRSDGTVRVAGIGHYYWVKGSTPYPVLADFSADGVESEISSPDSQGLGIVAGFADGDPLMVGGIDLNLYDALLYYPVERVADEEGPSSDGWSFTRRLSPGYQASLDAAYDEDAGEVVSVGYAGGPECSPECRSLRTMVIARHDAETGEGVAPFGTAGVKIFPPNSCPFGPAAGPSPSPFWRRCKVSPPDPSGSARIEFPRKRRPALTAWLDGGPMPRGIHGTASTFTIELPKAVRLTKGGLRDRVAITESTGFEAPSEILIREKRIIVRIDGQAWNPWEGPFEDEVTPAFRLVIRRGALAPLSRRIRLGRRPLALKVGVTYTPAPDQPNFQNPSGWFGPNSSGTRVKVRIK